MSSWTKVPTAVVPPVITPSTTTSTAPLLTTGPASVSSTTAILTTTSSSTVPTTTSTSTSSSTLVTPTVAPPTATSSTTPVVPTATVQPTTEVQVTVTQSQSHTSSATSLAASPTTSTAPTSTVSTGVLIGGILAVVIAVAGIVFAVVYFIRRNRKAGEDDFNPDEFRRQSVFLPGDDDASGFGRTWNRGGARPPTMIEQKLSHNPVSYTPPVPVHPYSYGAAYNQPSYSPGQVYNPTTPNSSNPFFSPYDHSPMPYHAQHDASYDRQGNVMSAHPSMASSTVVGSRRGSAGSNKPLPDVAVEGQYVDMSRSSVTPFQAAQYADISRHLNVTPPQGLPLTPVSEEHIPETPLPEKDIADTLELQGQHLSVEPVMHENAFPESPFADPTMAEQQQRLSQRESTDSVLQPPPPAFASSPRTRITSIPPMLPELTLQERSFSPVAMDFPAPPSTFGRPEPQISPLAAAPAAVPSTKEVSAAAKRPETVYDDEDAYGGI
uniref:Cytochrome P450 monooxygenase AKT7 ) n=1 Tax=Ganoderma boninense TaxID=34458 RepID=A0A5K1JZK8_9APHY|nr:Cytochrome P450 monooxygenase AKT7 (EC (AK-toxin biosynthesis protein 7) [Ganoderma boninense]